MSTWENNKKTSKLIEAFHTDFGFCARIEYVLNGIYIATIANSV